MSIGAVLADDLERALGFGVCGHCAFENDAGSKECAKNVQHDINRQADREAGRSWRCST